MEAVHVWTQTQSLAILKMNSLNTHTFSPSHDFDTSVYDDRERAAIKDFEYKCML